MRIIALDVGTKRIGVAGTDPLGLFAQPLKVIERQGGGQDTKAVGNICKEYEATLMVIGLPLNEEGDIGPQAKRIQVFASHLEGYFRREGMELVIEFWDERYSTVTAEKRLIEIDLSRKKRRKVIDKMAAVVILEDYLRAKEGGEK